MALAKKFRVSKTAMEMRLQQYEAEFGWGSGDESTSRETADGLPPLASDAWGILGVPPGTALAEVKTAYHRLLGQYHPDKYEHLAPEMKALAQQRTREIITAFELIEAQASVSRPDPRTSVRDHHQDALWWVAAEAAEILKKARWWITNRGWCQGATAKDGYGKKVVAYDSERAGHFSIVGAVCRAAEHNFAAQETVLKLVALAVRERPRFLDNWNDQPERTQQDIVQALDQAIRLAEELGGPK